MKINALKIRQSFGEVLKKLKKSGEPIIIEKSRQPVAVLISYETFQSRFIDFQDQKKREALINELENESVTASLSSIKVLREIRYGPRD